MTSASDMEPDSDVVDVDVVELVDRCRSDQVVRRGDEGHGRSVGTDHRVEARAVGRRRALDQVRVFGDQGCRLARDITQVDVVVARWCRSDRAGPGVRKTTRLPSPLMSEEYVVPYPVVSESLAGPVHALTRSVDPVPHPGLTSVTSGTATRLRAYSVHAVLHPA